MADMSARPGTVVAVGERSPLGRAVLKTAMERFDVQAVLFPTQEMYERFRVGPAPPRWRSWLRRVRSGVRSASPDPVPGEELGRRLSWEEICRTWGEGEFDLMLSGGFPAIFPDDVLARARRRVNVHTSLLPQLKGRHPHYWAIEWGLERSGLTAHEMTKQVDQGEVIGQVVVEIPPGTSYEQHYADLRAAVPELLDQVSNWLQTGQRVEPVRTEPSWSPGEPPEEHRRLRALRLLKR